MSNTTYWYVSGMRSPYWCVREAQDYPTRGEVTVVAHNRDADTDMGDLYGDEFKTYFPNAIQVSQDEYNNEMP